MGKMPATREDLGEVKREVKQPENEEGKSRREELAKRGRSRKKRRTKEK